MRSRSPARCLLLGAALLAPVVPSASAAKRPAKRAAEKDPSAALVAKGRAALASGDHAGATQALTDAYQRRSDPGVLLLLGQVALAEGRVIAAQDLFRRALAEAPEAGDAASRAAAQRAFSSEELTSEVSVLGERGALVFLDDRLVGRLPLPLPLLVAPGEHKLRLNEEGRERATTLEAPVHRRTELRIERDAGAILVSRLPLVVVQAGGEAVAEDVLARLGLAVAGRLRAERLSVAVSRRASAGGGATQPAAPEPVAGPGDLLFKLQVKQPAPGEWELDLSAMDPELPEPAAQEHLRCAPCTDEALAERLRERAPAVVRAGIGRPRGLIRVRSEPPGASVEIEGAARGVTPLELRRFAGSYTVRLSLKDYREALRPITVGEGQPVDLAVALDPIPKPKIAPLGPLLVTRTRRDKRPTWRLVLGGALIAGGAAVAGFGGGALSVDGKCIRPIEPPAERCDDLFQTATLGYSLIGSGAGLALIGTIMMAVPGPLRSYTVEVPRDATPPARPEKDEGAREGARQGDR